MKELPVSLAEYGHGEGLDSANVIGLTGAPAVVFNLASVLLAV